MNQNELIQWTVVSIIILIALVWVSLKIIISAKKNHNSNGCNCCDSLPHCKAKELKDAIDCQKQAKGYHDGQSARN